MKELISRLTEKAGLSEEQASNALSTMKDYLQEKFPMLEGMMDKLMGSDDEEGDTANSGVQGESIADKAGDMLNSMKEKAGDLLDSDQLDGLAKNASEMADDAINKLKDMFGGDKS